MRTSKKGIDLIKRHEGLQLTAYRCPANVLTVGYGHTGTDVREGMAINENQAEQLLINDLNTAEKAVNLYCKGLTQNQFDALVSFVFNIGVTAFKNSTLLKRIKENIWDETIRSEFRRWVYANGKPLAGLIKRREEEARLYFTR